MAAGRGGGRVGPGARPRVPPRDRASASGSAPRPRSAARRCRSRRPRSRWRSGRCSRCAAARCSCSAPARSREGLGRALVARRRRRRRRGEPHLRPRRRRWPSKLGGRPVPLGELPDVLAVGRRAAHRDRLHRGARRARRRRGGDGAPRRRAAARSSTSPCRATSTPARGQVAGRDAARHRRPASGSPRPRSTSAAARSPRSRDHRRGARAVPDRPRPPARSRRSSRAARRGPSRSASAELDALPRQARRARRPRPRNAVEALTQGIVNKLLHEPTVRLKDAAGTARGELYSDALGTLFDLELRTTPRNDPAPIRVATRGSALARWQAERVVALLGVAGRARDRDDHRRPRPHRRRSTRIGGNGVFVKEVQDAVLGAATPTSRCTRPRTCPPLTPRRPRDRRGARSGPTPATRWSGRRLGRPPDRRARSAPGPCAGGPSSRRSAPTSRSASCAATSRPGSSGPRDFDAIVVAAAALDRLELARPRRRGARAVDAAAAGRPGRARGRVPRRRRGRRVRALAAIDDADRARRGPRRARVPRRARRRLHPAVRRATRRPTADGGGLVLSTRCSRRSTGRSSCGRRSTRRPIPTRSARERRRAGCSTTQGGAHACSTRSCRAGADASGAAR